MHDVCASVKEVSRTSYAIIMSSIYLMHPPKTKKYLKPPIQSKYPFVRDAFTQDKKKFKEYDMIKVSP